MQIPYEWIHAGMDLRTRAAAIDNFQDNLMRGEEDEPIRVIIGTPKSARMRLSSNSSQSTGFPVNF